jgi:hypothetical protein
MKMQCSIYEVLVYKFPLRCPRGIYSNVTLLYNYAILARPSNMWVLENCSTDTGESRRAIIILMTGATVRATICKDARI